MHGVIWHEARCMCGQGMSSSVFFDAAIEGTRLTPIEGLKQ